jgi:drug/metabolite transporter (DMT)-like permease
MNEKYALRYWLLLILTGVIWGSSFILMKIGLRSLSPLEMAAWRMTAAMIVSSPFLFNALKKMQKKDWKFIVLAALSGSGIPAILYSIASTKIDSSINGVLNALTPLFTLIFGVYIFKNDTFKDKIVGVLVGFVGAALLISMRSQGISNSDLAYIILPVLAAALYGISSNTVKTYLSAYNTYIITPSLYIFLGIPAVTFLIWKNSFAGIEFSSEVFTFWIPNTNLEIQKAQSFLAVFFLGAFGTALANFVFYNLIQKTSVVFGSMTTYLIPIVAIFWGWTSGEMVTIYHFLAILLIFFGVWLVTKK